MPTETSTIPAWVIAVLLVGSGLGPPDSSISSVRAAELPQTSPHKHMGVATCANSVCHSVRVAEPTSNVAQNEYLIWQLHDRHAGAYKTLLSPASQRIANKLGLKTAAGADLCLDCHADNVPVDKRGPEFLITDGVGCEACHGGSEVWLSRHTLQPYNAARNITDGMYPTAPLGDRTRLCASCHVGNEQKLANHRIMGAGHPRLSFELDTFTIRQPEHYRVDADYLQRKNQDDHLSRLLTGTAVHAQWVARNLSGKLVSGVQGHPEIALYDCHSCHHSLTELQWQKRPSTTGLKPGMVRLNDSSFLLLSALTGAIDRQLQDNILLAIRRLHSASGQSIADLKRAAADLEQLALAAQKVFADASLTDAHKRQMLIAVMGLATRGEFHDYIAAEQGVMAMDALSFSLPANPELEQLVNQAYQLTEDDEAYQPEKLRQVLKAYQAR